MEWKADNTRQAIDWMIQSFLIRTEQLLDRPRSRQYVVPAFWPRPSV